MGEVSPGELDIQIVLTVGTPRVQDFSYTCLTVPFSKLMTAGELPGLNPDPCLR